MTINDQLVCTYVADYVYLTASDQEIVEDYKGHITDVFKLKKKLMKAIHGIEIRVVNKITEHPCKVGNSVRA